MREERRSPRLWTGGDEEKTRLTFTPSISHPQPAVNYRRLAPSIIVDSFATDENIDFAVSPFEDWYGGGE
jgi:hypothetical protein